MPQMCHHCTCVEDSVFLNGVDTLETFLEEGVFLKTSWGKDGALVWI